MLVNPYKKGRYRGEPVPASVSEELTIGLHLKWGCGCYGILIPP
jgi:hypothetical protein